MKRYTVELKAVLMVDGEAVSFDDADNFDGWDTIMKMTYVFQGVLDTVLIKNRQYGEAWQKQGWMGNLARIQSKVSRLKNMLWRDKPLESNAEPVYDTAHDLIAITAFMIMNQGDDNRWGK